MRVLLLASVFVLTVTSFACDRDDSSNDASGAVGLGTSVTIAADRFEVLDEQRELLGSDQPSGTITIAIDAVERPEFADGETPQGEWVAIHFTVQNDMNVLIQPQGHIVLHSHLEDADGRRWDSAPVSIAGAHAQGAGIEHPSAFLDPGFEITTAVLFDVPADA